MIHDSILSTIGNTPLVRLSRMPHEQNAEILAKVEFFNPGGSVKDRAALNMIEAAERSGVLKRGDVIIEPTSGNTGVGLALVAAVKGYEVFFVMPENMSMERRALLHQYGAEIILTAAAEGMTGAVAKAEHMAAAHGYFMPMQFRNPHNPEAHRQTTAQEIVRDLAGEPLHYFIAGVGTGGTLTGVGAVLKTIYPEIALIAVEPKDSPVLSGGRSGAHGLQGLGAGFIPEIYDARLVDEIVQVTLQDALKTAKALARQEGILAGISSGANLYAALQISRRVGSGKRLVVILPDTGERYLSTELFR